MTETEYLGNRTIEEYTKTKCEHFMLRLKQRYNLDITTEEYYSLIDQIRLNQNSKTDKKFFGIYKRKTGKSIGYIFFKDTKVWVMYDTTYKILITAYPSNIEINISQTIQSCFTKDIRPIAHLIYNDIQKEIKKLSKLKFEIDKEAYKYYALNTKYPSVHILLNKGRMLDFFKVCHSINSILSSKSKTVTLCLKRKNGKTKNDL